ncbi:MAG: sodium ion-translocating decarboxylase subunit beta [Thermoanaerobaculales bacterium]|jgi:oxaloacetate decarboxylase beta subunit|nr:sodium ion-translocating decarboxylase subunit beta [Thermoanaerobaculales bacterium]
MSRNLTTLGMTILALAVSTAAAAGTDLGISFDNDILIRLPIGASAGLVAPDGAGSTPSTGALRDPGGAVVGRFTVVAAGKKEAVAVVSEVAPGAGLGQVDHASVDLPAIDAVAFETLPADRHFRIDRGWNDRPDGLAPGAKGDLLTRTGSRGAIFQVIAVDRDRAFGRIVEYSPGVFNRDLVAARLHGTASQILAGTGFANLSWLNLVMLAIGCGFIYLGIAREYEPLLLVPIGFGILVGNIPLPLHIFNAVSVYMIDPVTHEYVFNTTTNSVMGLIYFGVRTGLFPPLIFLGIGALTDFSALLSSPRSVLLGAAAQVGIFATFIGALQLGFTPAEAASIGIIGGADGPTAIFLSSRLAPSLIGPIAIAAYSYMAMVPVIQPPIMKLLTTRSERLIRMKPGRKVPRRDKILFPVAGLIVTALVAPGGLPLLGMLFFGNLLKESGVTGRLAKSASGPVLDGATILLGLAVGASTSAQVFLTRQSILIFVLGCVAFAVATAGGVLFAKLMNLFSTDKINPLIGAAGVSAVPDSARVAHRIGQEEDPSNYLLQHALGPNVAGVIGSAIAAGVFLGIF